MLQVSSVGTVNTRQCRELTSMGLISVRQKQEGNAMQQTHKRSWSFTKPFSGLQALLSLSV
jgi:hypothetical protein